MDRLSAGTLREQMFVRYARRWGIKNPDPSPLRPAEWLRPPNSFRVADQRRVGIMNKRKLARQKAAVGGVSKGKQNESSK
ncbi:hypothetical protein TWF281_009572 [Arthrobotrys megalospora]